MRYKLFYSFFFIITCCFSQNETDSLLLVLEKNKKRDSTRVNHLIKVSNKLVYKTPYKAHNLVDEALTIATEINWAKGRALALRQKGLNYYMDGNNLKAVQLWYKALEENKNIDNNKIFEASILNNLANVYADMGQFDKALKNYKKLLSISKESKNKTYEIQSLTNIGTLLSEKKEHIDEGIVYLKEALLLAKKEKHKNFVASIYINLGLAYRRKDKYAKALNYYHKAIELAHITENKYVEIIALNNISIINTIQKNYKNAEINSKKALVLSKQTDDIEWQASAWEILNEIYESTNNNKKALEAYKNYIKLRDSFNLSENKEEINKLETQYKHNQEKILLKAEYEKNQIINQKELQHQNFIKKTYLIIGGSIIIVIIIGFILYRRKEQESFKTKVAETELKALKAQMNPHFIFNSLNSISNFVLNNDIDTAHDYLTKFAKLMRQTLESSEKQDILLVDDLELLKTYLDIETKRLNHSFTYQIIIDKDIDIKNTLVPPLILQPFIENSIWHGISKLEDKGHIIIEIKKDKNMIICSVEDNGVGRQNSNLNALKKELSLGTKITKNRIEIINKLKKTNGSVKLIDKEKGLKVEVKLPLELAF